MRLNRIFLLLTACMAAACQGCGKQPQSHLSDGTEPVAEVWTTSADGSRLLEAGSVRLMKPGDASFNRITLTGESFQTVDGFGLAITQASCYNLLKMSESDRSTFLKEVFSREEGLGSSLIRVCIGGSDFSMDEFTWCDEPGLEHFAAHPLDEQYLFPILDEIFAINPAVQIIASPWSCPLWMKVAEDGRTPHQVWYGGHLGEAYYRDYADYFVRWIREMERRGYPIMNSVSGLKAMKMVDGKTLCTNRWCWVTNFIFADGTRSPKCAGSLYEGVCDRCGFSMGGEMRSVFHLSPDTIFAGLKLRT